MTAPHKRDEDRFTTLYTAHYADVYRYALRRLADADAATELAQEVFVTAWRRRTEVPRPGLPWLYGVARRLLANQWRARRAAPGLVPLNDEVPNDELAAGTSPEGAAALADVRAALARLTEADQEILRLVGWEQLSLAETAEALGCSRGAAAVRLHRARRRLAAALAEPPLSLPARPAAARP